MITYTVKKGDTLTAIASKYNTTVNEIVKLNPIIKNPNLINIGWKLTIPEQKQEVTKDYEAIGKAMEKTLDAIEQLPEYKELMKVM